MLSSLRSRRFIALTAATGCLVAGSALLGPASSASAAPPGPHDPYGSVTGVHAVTGGLVFTGWAVDPDVRTANLYVGGLVDGITRSSVWTSVANRTVTTRQHAGATPGFAITVPVASGSHTACIYIGNQRQGRSTVLTCVATPLGTVLTAGQLARHNPTGTISSASANRSSISVSGFTNDIDFHNKHFDVVLYVDGRPAATIGTTATQAGAPAGSGRFASYSATVPVSTGTHFACVWAVNIGFGRNSFYGCRALDTRHGQAIAAGSPSTRINAKVLAEAKKHIGQRYVWGATGPRKFDCSGLVVYSYKKQGFVTPRVSEDQALAARLIPASRAIPGDLVFYHDSVGDVYHVGIYSGPNMSVAAIDTQEGVNYQNIWDPTWATYGSFTHT